MDFTFHFTLELDKKKIKIEMREKLMMFAIKIIKKTVVY